MRYYEFSVKINESEVFKNAKSDVGYIENAPAGMSQFLYKHSANNMLSFAFGKEKSLVNIALCFDEKEISLDDVEKKIYCLLSELDSNFALAEPFTEITRFQFRDDINESRRREYMVLRHKMTEFSKIDMLDYDEDHRISFNLQEKLIPDFSLSVHNIYDQSLKDEIEKITDNKGSIDCSIIPVHYIISAKTDDAIYDMASVLINRLFNCNRLSSKRIEIIDDISICLYKKNFFESIVEDSYGGVVIINMNTQLCATPAAYLMTCEYMADIIKKHKNHCQFIFAYTTSAPSFAYQLISKLEQNVKILPIKEGHGDKKDAEAYLNALAKSSECPGDLAGIKDFMKTFHKDSFSQSDVFNCLDKYKTWCINVEASSGYGFINADEIFHNNEIFSSSSEKRLNEMIGLNNVKTQIKEIIAANIVDRERKHRRDDQYEARTMHMVFAGNPGTAKTTVAKLFGQIAKENNLLKSGVFVAKSGTDLTLIGDNSITDVFEAAKGGILFIDEAYAINGNTLITTLIQEIENHRDEVITIFAGYSDSMKNFLKSNDGLKSRIPYWIDFPDYSADELVEIFELMLHDRGFTASEECKKAAHADFEKALVMENFGNGRYVRNYIDEAIKKQSIRLYSSRKSVEKISDKALFTLDIKDINPDYEVSRNKNGKNAKEELAEMIGLESAKKVLNKAIASMKMRKTYNELGISQDKPTMHMVFTGNPGTAKTTAARLIAQILKDENVLSSGVFVEAGRADLVGLFVGQTAPLIKDQFKKARGGVLFIDEAYSLCDSYSGYGDEAINTIVQEMENHREDVVVIFAGYPKEMKEFLERNPGMKSRIAFNVNFEDYSADELISITKLMLKNKHMKITPAALDKLHNIYANVSKDTSFGNGRYVRQIIEEACMNLAERLMKNDPAKLSKKVLTTIEANDIPDKKTSQINNVKMGFSISS